MDYAQKNWNKLDSKEKKKVLSMLFPDMNEEAKKEISQLQFNYLPSKHTGTKKDIINTLFMAVTREGFSIQEETKIRDTFAR